MKLLAFSIYDSKAEAYLQPFFSQTIGTALRDFEAAVNTEDHQFAKYAADYTLFHLGDFDQGNAEFNLLPSPINLGCAITFIKGPDA